MRTEYVGFSRPTRPEELRGSLPLGVGGMLYEHSDSTQRLETFPGALHRET